ncbi:MAG: FkbM family methyltransferase [Desulfobacteraceae bacterium]|nr:FkbM family methyltransferase [Desulfobacteraceae bacterium]
MDIPVRHWVRFILQAEYRLKQRELKRLQFIPRFTPTTTLLLGKKIDIVDSASFLSMYSEIFKKQIYRFNANTKSPLIIDCGANIGLSVIYFKKLFPESRVIAFEPDETIFGVFKKNVTTFGFTDVQLIQKALWSSETMLKFHQEGADGGRIAKPGDDKIIEVPSVRLKEYLREPVDFLKLDVEGAETEVLRDCVDNLNNVQKIFVEYHSFLHEAQNLDEILAIFKNKSFRYWIHHIGVFSQRPLFRVKSSGGMDLQLNIYASQPDVTVYKPD